MSEKQVEDIEASRLPTTYSGPAIDGAVNEPTIEKRDSIVPSEGVPEDLKEELEQTHIDVYAPFPIDENAKEEGNILTIRALFVGCVLGALVNASNVYLGLKTGWTFTANMLGALGGFAIIKLISLTKIPWIGGYFGPMENNIVQTAATAAGGLGTIFVSAVPALYQMNLLSKNPADDYWKLISFTAVSAYFGFTFAVPLRKFFIIHIARELNLVYPTASATALTIRSMHLSTGGLESAKKRIKGLSIAFIFAFIQRVVSQYAIGILWDWHVFWWIYTWGGKGAIALVNWGWYLEWTPAFIGSGMLVGLNAAYSFLAGSIIAWGIIGPTLVAYDAAFCQRASENYPDMWNCNGLRLADPKNAPSPRYWMIWPGVLLMMAVSFAELAVNYKIIGKAFGAATTMGAKRLNAFLERHGKSNKFITKMAAKPISADTMEDPSPKEDQVPAWMWGIGCIGVIILTCVVLGLQYEFPVGYSILSLVLGLFFALLAIQCTGATDITPITTVSKASQLIMGGVTKGQGTAIHTAQLYNLMSGAVAAGAASQSTDLVNDFKVGFLLRTPPRVQWYAQGVGSFVSIWLAPSIFVLFTKAYPCIVDLELSDSCDFLAPSVSAWRAVAVAMTDPSFPIPTSSGIFAIVISIVGVLVVIGRHYLNSTGHTKAAKFMPNMMVLGLGFLLPQTQYSTAMCIGATIAYLWQKKWPLTFEIYCFSIAAGLIAGEGIGGVINALFQVVNISGNTLGTNPYIAPHCWLWSRIS
ncbi:uncharacterized protein DFL_008456 [Arthrobotrys flagrans]|uniref:OPT superfamily oligopeptide transporter n=1 Tax=Arthrobotrys flagrans TaxID=97331 RepID=A0A436ZNT4_ARTFL|nr:hypothetical protein DFL_008456 [Arthrobotrys flagrans]